MASKLNESHNDQVVAFLRFAKYQREICIKCVKSAIEDTKATRLSDDTFTLEEVEETIDAVTEAVTAEVESELINAAHTNVLLLQQVFCQAEKWHLNLETDLSELENRELLNAVRDWENSQLSLPKEDKPFLEKKRLAPLNEGGPTQLLTLHIQELEQENNTLKQKLKNVEKDAIDTLDEKNKLSLALEQLSSRPREGEVKEVVVDNSKELQELSETVEAVRNELITEKQISEKTQQELESDLTSTKHRFLEVQHQLNLAEKELEKRFSETGAFKNMKKMLSSKNDTIRELRKKLVTYEPDKEATEEE